MLNIDNATHIKELPEFVVNQIKAGEVIERPSQLFKEIIENSIDALSKNIEIKIRNNGLDLIQIIDDGVGISIDELPLAFKRHATSKIQNFSDIYEIYSFGFRGEALASISAISKVTCTSLKEGDLEGGKITIEGGNTVFHEAVKKQSRGTTLSISDLFYNTPVRLKFLKSQKAERRAILNILESFLISWPQVSFSIQWDDEEVMSYPATPVHNDRIKAVMFKKKQLQDGIHKVDEEYDDFQVKAFFSPQGSRGGYKKQYLFVNGRLFFEKSLHFFICKQFEQIWGPGNSGHYTVLLSIPSDQIDVNVHPSKTQIKFADESLIYSLLSKGIKQIISHHQPETNLAEKSSDQEQLPLNQGHSNFTSPSQEQTSAITPNYREAGHQEGGLHFLPISNDFFILKNDEESKNPLLIEKSNFLRKFLENFLLKSDEVGIPLIISDPFPKHELNDKDFEFILNEYCIELEELDDQIVLLRSIPKSLSKLPYKEIISALLEGYKTNQKFDFQQIDLSSASSRFFPHQIAAVIKEYELDAEDSYFSLPLTKDLFNPHDLKK